MSLFPLVQSNDIQYLPSRRYALCGSNSRKDMGSHLGVTLQAGVAARSHRRHKDEHAQDSDNFTSFDSTNGSQSNTTGPQRKVSYKSGKSSHSSGTTVAESIQTGRGEALLHIATRHNRNDVVLREIQNGADVNVQTKSLQTPLHIACQRGHIDCVKTLLANGAELEVWNSHGETPLQIAKSKSYVHIVRLLVLQGTFVGRGTTRALADGIRRLG